MSDRHSDEPSNGRSRPPEWQSVLEAWRRARARVPEFERHLLNYGSLQVERLRLTARRLMLRLVIAALAGIAAITITVSAAVLVAKGLAGGFAALCGDREWLGNVLAGVVISGGLSGMVIVGYVRKRGRERERLLRRYAPDAIVPVPAPSHESGHAAPAP